MKTCITVLLLAATIAFAADSTKLSGLPAPEDVFVIAVSPHSKSLKDYFTPDSLIQALPKLVPADVQLPVGGKVYWQSGVIVQKDKKVLFFRTCGDWFIAVDTPSGTTFYAFEKGQAPN